jgi:DNA-nicking Smr family endonuclease
MNLWEKEKMLYQRIVSGRVGRPAGFDKEKTKKLLDNIAGNRTFPYVDDYDATLCLGENLGIDYNTDKKLKGGKIKIDKTVDFHGLGLDDALDLLLKTVGDGYANGLRNILFITGKGRNSNGRETIKASMEKWFRHPSIVGKIIKYCQATKKDGGDGAFYVFLRRKKYRL